MLLTERRFYQSMNALKKAKDKKYRAVILTGAGGAFCAGADLTEFATVEDMDSAPICARVSTQWLSHRFG